MNLLNRVGGALLLLGIAIAVYLGFNTPTGRPFWDGIWQAGSTVVNFARTQTERLAGRGTSGNLAGSVGLMAVVVIIVMMLLKWPISVRTFTILLVLAAAGAFVLYNPTIV